MTFSTNKQPEIDALIASSLDPDPALVYKQNVGGSEEGTYASSYSTSFFNSVSDPEDATISFVSGSYITASNIYLLVKDGNHTPAGYLFDISGWDGKVDLVLTDFWPNGGAISHVSIYASGVGVPDGGTTLMLLGIALAGLIAARRLVLPRPLSQVPMS